MKKQKLSLNDLKVKSFVTRQDKKESLKGGAFGEPTQDTDCFDTCSMPPYCNQGLA